MNIGELIRDTRKKKKISTEKLSKSIGISRPFLTQIELGTRNASPELLKTIADELELSYMDLLIAAGYMESLDSLIKKTELKILPENFSNLYKQLIDYKNAISNSNEYIQSPVLDSLDQILLILDKIFIILNSPAMQRDLYHATARDIIEVYRLDNIDGKAEYQIENIFNGNIDLRLNGKLLSKDEIKKALEILTLIYN